jgi:hypothetical protein
MFDAESFAEYSSPLNLFVMRQSLGGKFGDGPTKFASQLGQTAFADDGAVTGARALIG